MQLIATKITMSKYETQQTHYNDLMNHQYFNVYYAFDLHVYQKNQNSLWVVKNKISFLISRLIGKVESRINIINRKL